jgi:hypothetical protein
MLGELSANSYDLILREVADVSEEVALYRRWHKEARSRRGVPDQPAP